MVSRKEVMLTRLAVKNLIRNMSCNTCLYYNAASKMKCWKDAGKKDWHTFSIPAERTCEDWVSNKTIMNQQGESYEY